MGVNARKRKPKGKKMDSLRKMDSYSEKVYSCSGKWTRGQKNGLVVRKIDSCSEKWTRGQKNGRVVRNVDSTARRGVPTPEKVALREKNRG